MSILEAMGYGLPIVATNVGGIPQLVENGKNGYMVEPGKIDDFAKVILELTGLFTVWERKALKKHMRSIL